jgi:hypothetical protein
MPHLRFHPQLPPPSLITGALQSLLSLLVSHPLQQPSFKNVTEFWFFLRISFCRLSFWAIFGACQHKARRTDGVLHSKLRCKAASKGAQLRRRLVLGNCHFGLCPKMFKAVSTNAKLITSCLQSILIKKDAVRSEPAIANVESHRFSSQLFFISVRFCFAFSPGH